MHSYAGGRYGYKVRRHKDAKFATIAALGAIGNAKVEQSFVLAISDNSRMKTGVYIGNSEANRSITGVGFQPDVVIIKSENAHNALCRTASMPSSGTNTKKLTSKTPLIANRITSLDVDGFTIGNNTTINGNGVTYYWIAFRAIDGEVAVGSYTGNGIDDRVILIESTSDSVRFSPDYVIVMSESNDPPVQYSSAMPGNQSFQFDDKGPLANCIKSSNPNGFKVGVDSKVNDADGRTYYYVAWKAVPDIMAVGSYTGNGIDNRDIIGIGFDPKYVNIISNAAYKGIHRPHSIDSGTDKSLPFDNSPADSDRIQTLLSDGFQVGRDNEVNELSTIYYWMAWDNG
jgi:hypothetical protein